MTSRLRNLHRFAWILITITGIVFLVFTVKDLNLKSSAKPMIKENEYVKVTMGINSLQIEVKESLRSSSSVIYSINSKGEKVKVLGQLQSEGNYEFELIEPLSGIIIEDKIKETELLKLNF